MFGTTQKKDHGERLAKHDFLPVLVPPVTFVGSYRPMPTTEKKIKKMEWKVTTLLSFNPIGGKQLVHDLNNVLKMKQ